MRRIVGGFLAILLSCTVALAQTTTLPEVTTTTTLAGGTTTTTPPGGTTTTTLAEVTTTTFAGATTTTTTFICSPDTDGDGEIDLTDECPGTHADQPVDQAGCSLLQFCSRIDATTREGLRECKKADWQNDEPFMRPRDADCVVDRGARTKGDERCVPVVPEPPTTTSTSTTTSSCPAPLPTTTSTLPTPCENDGHGGCTAGFCGGFCGGGECRMDDQGFCQCLPRPVCSGACDCGLSCVLNSQNQCRCEGSPTCGGQCLGECPQGQTCIALDSLPGCPGGESYACQ